MFTTTTRLHADVARWQAQGWITEAGAAEIRRDLDARRSGAGPYAALAVLGALLLGCAAMSFVAANWEAMSKLTRLAILGGTLAASYGAAYELFHRRFDAFAHAAVLAGVGLFGGSIMLIAQMYHMDGNPPDAVWLWAMGGLTAGWLLSSNPALAMTTALLFVWSVMTVTQDSAHTHWAFLPMWALTAAAVSTTRWRHGMHLLALALSAWIVMSCVQSDHLSGRYVLTAIGLALAATAALGGETIDRWRRISGTMLTHGMVLAYIGLFLIQFLPSSVWSRMDAPNLWLWGGGTLALLIGAMSAGWRTGNGRILWLAYVLFCIEVFGLYVKKIGSLLGTSAFFLITGLLVIALAAIAYRMRAQRTPAHGALP